MDKLYIVMPAYNEEGTIAQVAEEWHAVVDSVGNGSRLVIVNDGSNDGTAGILENIKNSYPRLIVINKENSGHGPTCIRAYQYAVDKGADWIFQTDSDRQTRAADFRGFWEKRNEYDFIIGWRSRRDDDFSRRVISRILKLTLLAIFRVTVKDANTPFRLMKADCLRRYLPLIPDDYFLPNTLLSVMVTKNKERVLWPEISFISRASGVSSIPLIRFVRLGMKLIWQLYKMRNIKLPQ